MEQWQSELNEWLGSHSGIVSSRVLTDLGCAPRTAYRMVERGDLIRVMPGVFRSPHWPMDRTQLMTAVCLRNPRALISFTTAAEIWNFRRVRRENIVHVLVPHGCTPTLAHTAHIGVVVHSCRTIDKVDIVERRDGIRLTSPTRTLFDCADSIGDAAAASVLEQLINDGRGTFSTHAATLTRLGRPLRPGTKTMQRVIGSRPAWRRAMQSDLEARVLAEIARQGLEPPEVQYRFELPTGREIRFDFAWPRPRVGLEVDHPFWHAGAQESHRDKHRDRKAATVGWTTVRVTNLDVDGGLPESIADVAAILGQFAA